MPLSNLPPGCNESDISLHAGDYEIACTRCEEYYLGTDLNEDNVCDKCVEKEEQLVCPDCKDEGELNCYDVELKSWHWLPCKRCEKGQQQEKEQQENENTK